MPVPVTILAATLYFAAVFAAGFVLGTLRVMVLEPALGALTAVALELPVMLALSWLVAGWLRRAGRMPATGAWRLGMGALAFALLIGAEAGVAILGFGLDLRGFLAGFTAAPGLLGLAGQTGFALIPWLHGHLR